MALDIDAAMEVQTTIRQLIAEPGKDIGIIGVFHSDGNLPPVIIDPRSDERPSAWPGGAWQSLLAECTKRDCSAVVVGASIYVGMLRALAPALPGFSKIDPSFDGLPAIDLPTR